MTVGEKIKFYREMRMLSQADLAHLAGISLSALKKYETNIRSPKVSQIRKIADVLNISPNALSNITTDSIGDIIPYLFAIAKVGNIHFYGSKDNTGKYIADDLKFSFDSPILKNFMKEWANKKNILDKLRQEAQDSPDEQAKEYLLNRADEIENEIELLMIDSQLFISNEKSENNKN